MNESDEGTELACIVCGCTQENACLIPGEEESEEACAWLCQGPPLCSNPECVAAAARSHSELQTGGGKRKRIKLSDAILAVLSDAKKPLAIHEIGVAVSAAHPEIGDRLFSIPATLKRLVGDSKIALEDTTVHNFQKGHGPRWRGNRYSLAS